MPLNRDDDRDLNIKALKRSLGFPKSGVPFWGSPERIRGLCWGLPNSRAYRAPRGHDPDTDALGFRV